MRSVTHALLILVVMAGAASAETGKLSVKEVVRIAAENSNRARAAGFQAQAAQSAASAAGSRYLPRINFEETFAIANSPTQTFMMKLDQGRFTQNDFATLNNPGTQHDFKTSLTLVQPLFDLSISSSREVAVRQAEAAGFGRESARQEMAFAAFRLYLELQKAKAQEYALEAALKEAGESLRLATVQVKAGTGMRSDELRARTHQASVEQSLFSAKNRVLLTRMQLSDLLNLKDGVILEVEDTVPAVATESSEEQLLRIALENRADLKMSVSLLEKADAEARLARNSYFPSLAGFAGYQLNSRNSPFSVDNDAWMVGVALKWQLFDGLGRYSDYRRASASRSADVELHENRIKALKYSVRESLMKRDEAGKRLAVARHAVQDAEETVRLLSRRYENALATMFELLDSRTVLNQARSNLIENEAEYAFSGGQVLYAAGIFLKEMLK